MFGALTAVNARKSLEKSNLMDWQLMYISVAILRNRLIH